MNHTNAITVGIIVPTMNRPDFIIRMLDYHASLNSPHSIYMADSSNEEDVKKIKKRVEDLKNKINISYHSYPPGDTIKCIIFLLQQVKEKYVCFSGDDDYHIPGALTECTQFLENNPDYNSAIGQSVTFKLLGNGAYGKIKEIHDYPRHSVEQETASARLVDFLGPSLTPAINCVCETKKLLKYFEDSYSIKDIVLKGEMLPSSFLIVDGKMKVIDRLGFVRQIHDSHFIVPDTYDWLMSQNWHDSYNQYKNKIAALLMKKDGISHEEAEKNFKKAFWNYLSIYLPRFYKNFALTVEPKTKKIKFRVRLVNSMPLLKKTYRRIRPLFNKKVQLHYEVLQTGSKYYKDFKPIMDSFNYRWESTDRNVLH